MQLVNYFICSLGGNERDLIIKKIIVKSEIQYEIKMILKKDNHSYISFYNALLHEGYKDLAALLHGGIPVVSSSDGKDSVSGITSYGLYP